MNILPDSLISHAGAAYTAYCESVGGKAFNGDLLPTWEFMCKDPSKTKLVEAWCRAADATIDHFIEN